MTAFGGNIAPYPPVQNGKEKRGGLLLPGPYNLAIQLATDTGWTAVSVFGVNWSGFGAGNAVPAYKRDALGWVCLEGMYKKGVALAYPDTLFTLPVGYRPATDHQFPVIANPGVLGWVKVATTGVITLEAGGSAAWTSLSGLRFDPAR